MYLDSRVETYIIGETAPIAQALSRMTANRLGLLFVVDCHGHAKGCFTDGDFRRWVTANPVAVDMDIPISEAMNRDFLSFPCTMPREQIRGRFNERYSRIPLVDERGRIVAIACRERPPLRIGERVIGHDSPTLIIAEIGNNHNGSIDAARTLIDLAVASGADAVKFQLRDLPTLYRNQGCNNDPREDLGSQYVLDQLARFQLSRDDLARAFEHARAQGVLPLCTPWDVASLEFLESLALTAYKVASADLTNHEFLQAIAATGKPIMLSTGMSTEGEIRDAAGVLDKAGAAYALLHCSSSYPPPFKDLNLRFMARLVDISQAAIGYSGHERGWHIPVAAVAMGARIIEKHFTDDRGKEGNDHRISLLPDEFAAMTVAIRQLEEAMGDGVRRISQGEVVNREALAKSLVAARSIAQGEVIGGRDIQVRGPGRGLPPCRKQQLIGQTAHRDIAAAEFFYPSDLSGVAETLRPYRFRRPWGLPVRFHDHAALTEKTNPDLLEFHLSYRDLDLDLATFFPKQQVRDLVVHAPEVFAGDFLLDLASAEPAIRQRSQQELKRVIDLGRALKAYFPNAKCPAIIVNVGGFSRDSFVEAPERDSRYHRAMESLGQIDRRGVEVIPQTMPPFPWLFGGQLYHNLFVDAASIVECCQHYSLRICLDVSHSKLACNQFGWSFRAFIETVAPFVRHLHLVDAANVDREGLQIGEGEIDFADLAKQLDTLAPEASFIPEIWQGHKDLGHGFAVALERLERWF